MADEFDPSQPFEPVEEEPPPPPPPPVEFDPAQPYEPVEAPAAQQPIPQPSSAAQMDSLAMREGQPLAGAPAPNAAAANLEAEHPILEHAVEGLIETAKGFVPTTVEQAAAFATPVVDAAHGVMQAGGSLRDILFGGKSINEAVAANYPEAGALSEVEQTPAYSKERFTQGFGILAQLGMGAAIGKSIQPTLRSILFKEKIGDPAPITATIAEKEVVPDAKPITEPTTAAAPEAQPVPEAVAPVEPVQAVSGIEEAKVAPEAVGTGEVTPPFKPVISEDYVYRIRAHYTEGASPKGIKSGFAISQEMFDDVLSGKYGKGKIGSKKMVEAMPVQETPVSTTGSGIQKESATAQPLPETTRPLGTTANELLGELDKATERGDRVVAHVLKRTIERLPAEERDAGVRLRHPDLFPETKTPTEGAPSASQEPITESVTQPEVRTQVGEGAPLRQQGKTTEARKGIEEGTQTPEDAITPIRKAVDRYDLEEQHAGASELANDLENIPNLPKPLKQALDDYRNAVKADKEEFGERSGLESEYGDRLEKSAREHAGEITETPATTTPVVESTIDVSPILNAKTQQEALSIGGRLVVEAKTSADIAKAKNALQSWKPPTPLTEPPAATPPTIEAVAPVPKKPSKIGQSIEAKAVEAKLTQGFAETMGYDPIGIKDQANRATSFIKDNPIESRAVVRGEAPLPKDLKGTSLITAMEEELLRKPDAQLAYELANSPLIRATSEAAQEMRLMQERVPDSLTAKFNEILEARRAGSKKRGETPERLSREINQEVVKQSSKRPTWEAFVREITCA